MIRFIVLDTNGMYTSIVDEIYSDDEKDERILNYSEEGFLIVKITY